MKLNWFHNGHDEKPEIKYICVVDTRHVDRIPNLPANMLVIWAHQAPQPITLIKVD